MPRIARPGLLWRSLSGELLGAHPLHASKSGIAWEHKWLKNDWRVDLWLVRFILVSKQAHCGVKSVDFRNNGVFFKTLDSGQGPPLSLVELTWSSYAWNYLRIRSAREKTLINTHLVATIAYLAPPPHFSTALNGTTQDMRRSIRLRCRINKTRGVCGEFGGGYSTSSYSMNDGHGVGVVNVVVCV